MASKNLFAYGASLLIGAVIAAQSLRSNQNLAPTTSSRPTTPDVVEARRFVLRDSKDRIRAVLECQADERPSLSFMNENGDTKLEVGISAGDMGEVLLFDGGTITISGSENETAFELIVIPEFEPELWLSSKAGHLRLATGALDLEGHDFGQPYTQPVGPRIELLSDGLDGRAALYANHGGGCGLALGVEPGEEEMGRQPPASAPSSQPTTTNGHPSVRIGIDGSGRADVQIR